MSSLFIVVLLATPGGALPSDETRCARGEAAACQSLVLQAARSGEEDPKPREAVARAQAVLKRRCLGPARKGCVDAAMLVQFLHRDGDLDERATLLRRGCEADEDLACTTLVGLDRPGTFDLLEARCRKGHVESCTDEARALWSGHGAPADPRRAVALFDAGCTKGDRVACEHLAQALEEGRPKAGVAADRARARQLLRRACDMNSETACWSLRDRERAEALVTHEAECAAGRAPSCVAAAEQRDELFAAWSDRKAATKLYSRACDLGSGAGCDALGRRYAAGSADDGLTQDRSRAADLYKKACAVAFAGGCGNLGVVTLEGRGVPVDERRAMALLHRACDLGSGRHCLDLVRIPDARGRALPAAERQGLIDKGLKALTAHCAVDERSACFDLAELYLEGKLVPRDVARVQENLDHACRLGLFEACHYFD